MTVPVVQKPFPRTVAVQEAAVRQAMEPRDPCVCECHPLDHELKRNGKLGACLYCECPEYFEREPE